MFQQLVGTIVTSAFGNCIDATTFNADNLSAGLWNGQLSLNSLLLKSTLLDGVDAPLSLKYGSIDMVDVIIPWNSLLDDDAIVRVSIKGLRVLICTTLETCSDELNKKEQAVKMLRVNLLEALQRPKRSEATTGSWWQSSVDYANSWLIENIIYKFLSKLEVVIEDIHVRLEDCVSRPDSAFCVGCCLEALTLRPADDDAETMLQTISKSLRLSGFSIYCRPLSADSLEASTRTLSRTPLQPPQLGRLLARSSLASSGHQYILHNLCIAIEAEVTIDSSLRRIQAEAVVDIPPMSVALDDRQYRDMLALVALLADHRHLQRLLLLRPSCTVAEDPAAWWRHAIHVVILKLRRQRTFLPPRERQRRSRDRIVYVELWKRQQHGVDTQEEELSATTHGLGEDDMLYPGFAEEEEDFRCAYRRLYYCSLARRRLAEEGWGQAMAGVPTLDPLAALVLAGLEQRLSADDIVYFRALARRDVERSNSLGAWVDQLMSSWTTVFQAAPALAAVETAIGADPWTVSLRSSLRLHKLELSLVLATDSPSFWTIRSSPFLRLELRGVDVEVDVSGSGSVGACVCHVESIAASEFTGTVASHILTFHRDSAVDSCDATFTAEWPSRSNADYVAALTVKLASPEILLVPAAPWVQSLSAFLDSGPVHVVTISPPRYRPIHSLSFLKESRDVLLESALGLSERLLVQLDVRAISVVVAAVDKRAVVLHVAALSASTAPMMKCLKSSRRRSHEVSPLRVNASTSNSGRLLSLSASPSARYATDEHNDALSVTTSVHGDDSPAHDGHLIDTYRVAVTGITSRLVSHYLHPTDASTICWLDPFDVHLEIHKLLDSSAACSFAPLTTALTTTSVNLNISTKAIDFLLAFADAVTVSEEPPPAASPPAAEDDAFFDSRTFPRTRSRRPTFSSDTDSVAFSISTFGNEKFFDPTTDLDAKAKAQSDEIKTAEEALRVASAELRFAAGDRRDSLLQLTAEQTAALRVLRSAYVDLLMEIELLNLQSDELADDMDEADLALDALPDTTPMNSRPCALETLISFRIKRARQSVLQPFHRKEMRYHLLALNRFTVPSVSVKFTAPALLLTAYVRGISLRLKHTGSSMQTSFLVDNVEAWDTVRGVSNQLLSSSQEEYAAHFIQAKYTAHFANPRLVQHTIKCKMGVLNVSLTKGVLEQVLQLSLASPQSSHTPPAREGPSSAKPETRPAQQLSVLLSNTVDVQIDVCTMRLKFADDKIEWGAVEITPLFFSGNLSAAAQSISFSLEGISLRMWGKSVFATAITAVGPLLRLTVSGNSATSVVVADGALHATAVNVDLGDAVQLLNALQAFASIVPRSPPSPPRTFTRAPPTRPAVATSPLSTLIPLLGYSHGKLDFVCGASSCKIAAGHSSFKAGYAGITLTHRFGSYCSFGGCDSSLSLKDIAASVDELPFLEPFTVDVRIATLPPPREAASDGEEHKDQLNERSDGDPPAGTSDKIRVQSNEMQVYCSISSIRFKIQRSFFELAAASERCLEALTVFSEGASASPRPPRSNSDMSPATDSSLLQQLTLGILFRFYLNLAELHLEFKHGADSCGLAVRGICFEFHDDLRVASSDSYAGAVKAFFRISSLYAKSQACSAAGERVILQTGDAAEACSLHAHLSRAGDLRLLMQCGSVAVFLNSALVDVIALSVKVMQVAVPRPAAFTGASAVAQPVIAPLEVRLSAVDSLSSDYKHKFTFLVSKESFALPLQLKSFSLSASSGAIRIVFALDPDPRSTAALTASINSIQLLSYYQDVSWEHLDETAAASEKSSSFWTNTTKVDSIEVTLSYGEGSEEPPLIEPFHVTVAQSFDVCIADTVRSCAVFNNIDVAVSTIRANIPSNYHWALYLADDFGGALSNSFGPAAPRKPTKQPPLHRAATMKSVHCSSALDVLGGCAYMSHFSIGIRLKELTVTVLSSQRDSYAVLLRLNCTDTQIAVQATGIHRPRCTVALQLSALFHDNDFLDLRPLLDPMDCIISVLLPSAVESVQWQMAPKSLESAVLPFKSDFNISICSTSRINLNFTPAAVRALIVTSDAFVSSKPVPMKPTDACIVCRNDSGLALGFQYCTANSCNRVPNGDGAVLLSRGDILELLRVDAKRLPRHLEVSIMGTPFTLQSFAVGAGFTHKQQELVVVARFTIKDNLKTLHFYSNLAIVNTTNIDIAVGCNSDGSDLLSVSGGSLMHTPCAWGEADSLWLLTEGDRRCEVPLRDPDDCMSSSATESVSCVHDGGTGSLRKYFIIRVTSECLQRGASSADDIMGRSVVFSAPVTLINQLACCVTAVLSKDAYKDDGSLVIAAGASASVLCVHARAHCYLAIRLALKGASTFSEYIRLDGYSDDAQFYTASVGIKFNGGSLLRVNVDVSYIDGARSIAVYVPFWLVSLSSRPVLYQHEEDDGDTSTLVCNGPDGLAADQFSTLLTADAVGNVLPSDGTVRVAQVGYSSAEKASARVCIKTGKSAWSRPVELGHDSPIPLDIAIAEPVKSESLVAWLSTAFTSRISTFVITSKPLSGKTHLVMIADRHVVMNASGWSLEVRQSRSDHKELITSGATYTLSFLSSLDMNQIQVRVAEAGWSWSSSISISGAADNILRLQNHERGVVAFIGVVVKVIDCRVLVTLNQAMAPFRIENYTYHALKVFQRGSSLSQKDFTALKPRHICSYAWDDLQAPREVSFETNYSQSDKNISLGSIAFDVKKSLARDNIILECDVDGLVKVIRIKDVLSSFQDHALAPLSDRGNSLYIGVSLPLCSVTVALDDQGTPALEMLLAGLELAYISTASEDHIVATMLSLSASNTSSSATFPTIVKFDTKSSAEPCLSFEVRIDNQHKGTCINYVRVALAPASLCIHGSDMLLLANNLSAAFSPPDSPSSPNDTSLMQAALRDIDRFQLLKPFKGASLLLIRRLEVSSVAVALTVSSLIGATEVNRLPNLSDAALAVIRLLCNYLIGLDASTLRFTELRLLDFHGTSTKLLNAILPHYNAQALGNVVLTMGSLTIIGAPVQAAQIVLGAMGDLLQAFSSSSSPLELGGNVIYRSCSLYTACLGSAVYSASRVSSSMRAGLQSLSTDPSEPATFASMLTAPYSEPVAGYAKHGVGGAVIGAITGGTKLMVAPTFLVLDSITNSLEEVSNLLIPTHLNPLEGRAASQRKYSFHEPEVNVVALQHGHEYKCPLCDGSALSITAFKVFLWTGPSRVLIAHVHSFQSIEIRYVIGIRDESDQQQPLYAVDLCIKQQCGDTDAETVGLRSFLFDSPTSMKLFIKTLKHLRPDLFDSIALEHFISIQYDI